MIRLATKDDAERIFAFWLNASFHCSPGRVHATRLDLDSWLDGSRSIALCEENGEIVCTEVFDPVTAQSHWTNVRTEDFTRVYPEVCRQVSEWCAKPLWGYCGYVPAVKLHLEIGWRERGDGTIEFG